MSKLGKKLIAAVKHATGPSCEVCGVSIMTGTLCNTHLQEALAIPAFLKRPNKKRRPKNVAPR